MFDSYDREQARRRAIPELTSLMEHNERLNPCTTEFYNSRTRRALVDDRIVYFFQYERPDDGSEVITWRELKFMKDSGRRNVIRHPMVLNFVNEKLLQWAYFYIAHIISYLVFLLLLSSYIFDKSGLQDFLSTLFLIVFGFCLVVKGAVKLQGGGISRWFILSYTFNIITYIATFLFIWTPLLFSYNNYNPDLKHFITWLLPIIAIISAWLNFLYILRKSPYGIYILMLSRILYSFSQIAIIWVPTLFAFAFAFHLVMRNSGQEPWEATEILSQNSTVARKLLTILQAITKTSAMMIGEVDADNVLERKEWIPNLLLLTFEITTVILLMNLLVSLAVGDVNELRQTAQEKLLDIKVNFAIEALQLSESCDCLSAHISMLHRKPTNNVLVIPNNGITFATSVDVNFDNSGASNLEVSQQNVSRKEFESHTIRRHPDGTPLKTFTTYFKNGIACNDSKSSRQEPNGNTSQNLVCHLYFSTTDQRMRMLTKRLIGGEVQLTLTGAIVQLIDSVQSGIEPFEGTINDLPIADIDNHETYRRKFAQWLIGLDWSSLL